jgi:histidine triad (HIT) family protein
MSLNCVFCRIIQKQAPANIVYEDPDVIAFLSHRPINVGHTLVVPKKHYANLSEIPEEEAACLFKITRRLTPAVQAATEAEGIRIVQNNGEAAGQVVFHLHVHIIPMNAGDMFRHGIGPRAPDLLEADAEKIRQKLTEN